MSLYSLVRKRHGVIIRHFQRVLQNGGAGTMKKCILCRIACSLVNPPWESPMLWRNEECYRVKVVSYSQSEDCAVNWKPRKTRAMWLLRTRVMWRMWPDSWRKIHICIREANARLSLSFGTFQRISPKSFTIKIWRQNGCPISWPMDSNVQM